MKDIAVKWIGLTLSAMLAGSGHASDSCAEFAGSDPNLLSHNGEALVHLQLEPNAIQVGEPFDLNLTTCASGVKVISADAAMPSHGHGMNYRPGIETESTGATVARGFLFHMPGEWEIRIVVKTGGEDISLVRPLEVSP